MSLDRLQKILARAGVASRRKSEAYITAGRVTVDGEVVTELGSKADPDVHDIRVDGRRIEPEPLEYWLLNKPPGVVCTNSDPAGRRRPIDLVPESTARLFPVGRLDADSRGLLILTNDGKLANLLTHPRYEVPKTYRATVGGRVTSDDLHRLRRGIHLAEGKAHAAKVTLDKKGSQQSILEITLREGKNRQIRRMLARLGHPVRDLVRTRIGRITSRGIGEGRTRRLSPDEVKYLKRLATEDRPSDGPDTSGRGRRRKKKPGGKGKRSSAGRKPRSGKKKGRGGGKKKRSS